MTLTLENVSVILGDRHVLKNISFEAGRGELIGLIGPNGAGKSTALKACAGLLARSTGLIKITDINIDEMSPRERALKMAYLPQERDIKWPISVSTVVGLGRRSRLGIGGALGAEDFAAVEEAMKAMDIEAFADRAATQLSGGELARVLMARALAQEPALLLADEPVAGLDPAHALALMGYLKKMTVEGMSIVVVIHDLTLAGQFCDRLLCLHKGEIANIGKARRVLNAKTLKEVYGVKAAIVQHQGSKLYVPVSRV